MKSFKKQVFDLVQSIPIGKVSTYGQIATLVGDINLSRNVGYALSSLETSERRVPWWRVVNREGILTINQQKGGIEKQIQKELLISEGVLFIEEWRVDMKRFLYDWKTK